MAKYISLDALEAELERLREVQPHDEFQPKEQNKFDWLTGKMFTIISLETFLSTLEVKEVDLVKEAEIFVQTKEFIENKESPVILIARHFLERGLALQKEG